MQHTALYSRTTSRFAGLAALLATTLLVSSGARAQTEVRLSLIAFDEELTQVLVRMEDPNQGIFLQIREIETGKVKKAIPTDNRNDELKKVKDQRKKKFKVEAVVEQVDPSGRYTVFGAPDNKRKNYDIMVMREGRVGILGSIPLKQEEGRKLIGKAILKEVVWSADGKTVFCLVNHKIERPTGPEDVDEISSFRFKAWKVKWIEPAPTEEEPSEE
ncbi:MAG: hypothetical protein IV100_17415 [Myxococcales bacterium]|nr:hypothetical protein [Myxococcales bacterium]